MIRLSVPPRWRAAMVVVLALGAAAEAAAYGGIGGFARGMAAQAAAQAERIRAEDAPLRRRLRDMRGFTPEARERLEMAAFLRRVDAASQSSGARILRLRPREKDAAVEMELGAAFPAFLRFAAQMEGLGATFRDLRIAGNDQTDRGDGGPRVGLTLDLPHGVSDPNQAALDRLSARMSGPGPLDPFAPPGGADGVIDLSAKHHLTAITRIGNATTATIDGQDYGLGDRMDGLTVLAIRDRIVLLAAASGRYMLKFDTKPD